MKNKSTFARGCLLGMAIGDAMGCTIDDSSWDEIKTNYGPNGLLGFDLQLSEYAPVTSYTQVAAFLCNGLLIALTRAKGDYTRWGKLALQEWTRSQQFYRDPEESRCFVTKYPMFHQRNCRDARMLETLRISDFGTVDEPTNHNNAPGAITAGIAAGLFFRPGRMDPEQVGPLAAGLIALTHGSPEAFLSGVVLAYTIAGILQEPDHSLSNQFRQAIAVMEGQFGSRFDEAELLALQLRRAMDLFRSGTVGPQEGMERLECLDAPQCLAGAMFACLANPEDFDGAITTAVNHSGMSAAVGAIAGAIMGAKLGAEALPEFYLESLECTEVLEILAEDMACGTPGRGLFDHAWDQKYEQGLPPEN